MNNFTSIFKSNQNVDSGVNSLNSSISNSLNSDATSSLSSTTSSSSRPMFRFGQQQSHQNNDTATNYGSTNSTIFVNSSNSNLNNRTSIKRSISQVPTSSNERRPLNNQYSISPSTNNNSLTNGNSPTTTVTNTNGVTLFNGAEIIDYKAAYELIKKENEQLKQTMQSVQNELDEANKV